MSHLVLSSSSVPRWTGKKYALNGWIPIFTDFLQMAINATIVKQRRDRPAIKQREYVWQKVILAS
jgi:hypothetical protein